MTLGQRGFQAGQWGGGRQGSGEDEGRCRIIAETGECVKVLLLSMKEEEGGV